MDQVQWRVTNTTNDKKRGQIVPYADPRAYTDRLNALFSPQGWTREYKIETMNNITRMKKGESIVSGKVLVTCTVTIIGLWSHSGTGEEWADDDNGMTSADAQAFKRAVRASVWAATSTIFPQCGSIWTRTASPREHRSCPLGLFLKTGVKECDPRAGMATERQTQDSKRGVRTKQATATMDKHPLAQIPPQRATAATGKARPRRLTARLPLPKPTTSMSAFCAWKRLLAQPSIVASSASMAA